MKAGAAVPAAPLRDDAVAVVERFHHRGDLLAGFTRFQCPDCGHEHLLAFWNGRPPIPSGNRRRSLPTTGASRFSGGDPGPPGAPAD